MATETEKTITMPIITTIFVKKDECLCDEDDIQDYVDVLNGIVYDCRHGGFSVGYRNTVAVDLAVASYMLGLDANDVLDKLVEEDVINPVNDDEDTFHRVDTVLCYRGDFCWHYMIDPEFYVRIAHEHEYDIMIMPVSFRVS